MLGTELPLLPAPHAVARAHRAAAVGALLLVDIHHPIVRVRAAEPGLGAGGTVGRLLGAALLLAPLVDDIHHAVRGVRGAKLRPLAARRSVVGPRGAPRMVALLADDLHHADRSVSAAELCLSCSFDPEAGLLDTCLVAALTRHFVFQARTAPPTDPAAM